MARRNQSILFAIARIFWLEKVIALKKCLVRFGIHPPRLRQLAGLFRLERGVNLKGDGSRYLTLECQYVCEVALVLLRPEVSVVSCSNELRADSHLAARSGDSTFNDGVRFQFPRYVGQRLSCATFVSHHRGARNHVQ